MSPESKRRGRVVQPILGLVAPAGPTITPSQREMVRRAGTHLSIQQQMAERRRARADEATVVDHVIAPDVAALLPKLGRMK